MFISWCFGDAKDNFPGLGGVVQVQAQFLDMIADGQGDDGAVSDITPTVWQLGSMQPSDASWGSVSRACASSMVQYGTK
eukprot:SAG31_NODE_27434_length_426_cov_0.746177_1_plen_79_part_00